MPLHLLFVYGSLKRGHRNHAELRRARFVREAATVAAYRLLDLGDYPALTRGSRAVLGELYEVDDALLFRLDAFEGDGYCRDWVELSGASRAQAYFASSESVAEGSDLQADEWLAPTAKAATRRAHPVG